ncbi:MAG: sigma-70 family RNA polymerase sigma factor, partial [Vicinamibacterales bacterium]
MPGSPEDAQLEALVRQFSRLVRSVAGRVGGPQGRQIADDVEQHVFLNLWKQLRREQNIENPGSYIYRCAVRETVRLLSVERKADHEGDDAAEFVRDPAIGPDDQVASRERSRLVAEALRTLPPDRRRAAQAYLAGFSVPETMTMFGWSYERARNLSARGMADLRAALRERGIDG